jgi:hypothetical protein
MSDNYAKKHQHNPAKKGDKKKKRGSFKSNKAVMRAWASDQIKTKVNQMRMANRNKKLLAEIKAGKGIGYDPKTNQLEFKKAKILIKITAERYLQQDRVQEMVMGLRNGSRKNQNIKSILKRI